MNSLKKFEDWFKKEEKKIFNDFFNFLSFQTVSAKKQNLKNLENCVKYLKDIYEKIGFQAEIIETKYAPCLVLEKIYDNKAKTVLFYNHYDVQPEEPLELWNSNPFEAVIKDGAVYARGAQDNKGQCFYTYIALKAFHDLQQDMPFNIKIIIEGEEEIGSINLEDVLKLNASKLKADYLYIVDSGLKSLDSPVVGVGARGILSYQLNLKTQSTDLHSGEHGGMAFSATRAIVELLSKCYDKNGKVLIDGFYDDVKKVNLDPKIYDVYIDEKNYKETFGIKVLGNLPGTSLIESNWVNPTLEINGIYGGYTQEGFKTVLPCEAHAKLSIRTVPNQNPQLITKNLKTFLEKNVRQGVEIDLEVLSLGDYIVSNAESECVQIAKQAYTDVFNKNCLLSLCGGSIPITAKLAKISNADVCLIGTGLIDDNIHAPNERFKIESFEKGFLTIVRILDILKKNSNKN